MADLVNYACKSFIKLSPDGHGCLKSLASLPKMHCRQGYSRSWFKICNIQTPGSLLLTHITRVLKTLILFLIKIKCK